MTDPEKICLDVLDACTPFGHEEGTKIIADALRSARASAYGERLKRYRSGCACHLSEDGEIIERTCNLHKEALAAARDEALEEAAQAIDCKCEIDHVEICSNWYCGRDQATAIRALKGKP